MSSYRLSRLARVDLKGIARESALHWGSIRAKQYIFSLHGTFERLAAFPDLGRDASALRPAYRRWTSGSHVIFYRQTDYGILVVRVLHERMDFKRHL